MADNLQDLKKQISQLQKEIKNLGGETFKDINAAIKAFGGGIEGAKKLINNMKNDVEDLRDTFGNISTTLKNIVKDLRGANDPVKETTKSFGKLESLTSKILEHKRGEEILTIKQLKNIQKQTAAEVTRLKELKNNLDEQSDAYKEINGALNKKTGYLKDINEQIGKELETEQKIQKTLGVTGGLFKGIAKSLEHIGIESEHFENINKDLREAAKSGNSFKVLGAGIKSVGSSLKEAFKDPLVQVAIVGKLLKEAIEYANHFDNETVKIQRNLGLSYKAAESMNFEFRSIAKNIGRTHEDVVAANASINEFLGTNVMFSQQQLDNQVKLTKEAGLEENEREGIFRLSLLSGKTQEQVYNSIGKQNKGILSNRKVLAEVTKISGQLAAQYKNNPDLLAKAVVQAQKLGMTLEQTKNISRNLLNFEESISAELDAELLTGMNLNAEKARYLALQGKSAEAAEELMKNLGPNGLEKFQKMNVIQQEALAKFMGMSTDELANSLIKRKQLSVLTEQDKKSLQKKVEELKLQGKTEQAAELERLAIKNKSVTLADQELSKQEKQAEAVKQMKESFMQFMIGPVKKAMDFFSGVMKTIADNKILSALIGGVGLAATAAGILSIGRSIVNAFRVPRGSSPSHPMYTKDVGIGGSNVGGGIVDQMGGLGGGRQASLGKQLKTLVTKPKVFARALTRSGGSILGGLGKGALNLGKGALGLGSKAGGIGAAITASLMTGKGLYDFFSDEKLRKTGAGGFFEGLGGTGMHILDTMTFGLTKLATNAAGVSIPGMDTDDVASARSIFHASGRDPDNSRFPMSTDNKQLINDILKNPGEYPEGIVEAAKGVNITELATGGMVTRPTRALVGEAGPEAVVPLDKFYAKIDELISAVRQGGNIYLDSRKVGSTMDESTYRLNS